MNSVDNELALAPLGAGDLIDRAVRLYRRHFLTLIRIAAPPVLISALGSTITTVAFREIGATSSELWVALYVLLLMGGGIITICGSLFSLIIMVGAFAFASVSAWVSGIFTAVGTIAAIIAWLILFFLLAGRMAYVPQAMLVEG